MFSRAFILCAALATAATAFAQAYRWVDEDGVVHYSDRPQPGAERVELETAPGVEMRVPRRSATPREAAAEDDADAASVYESLVVASPGAEETLWNIGGVLEVTLNLQPALRPGHQVRVYFDGEARPVSGTRFQLEEVYRGVHNIQAEVVDQNGNLMIRSQPNRFYVQQTSIVNPGA